MTATWRVGIAFLAWAGAGAAAVAGGQPPADPAQVASWVVYWDQEDSLRAFEAQRSGLEEVGVFAYRFDADCRVVPATPRVPGILQRLTTPAQARPPRILVSIVNDVTDAQGRQTLKDPQCVHRVVSSPEAMTAHLDQILAASTEADGVELDYENLWARDREAFSRLVATVAERLHARGQRLSVVVQAKTRDHRLDGAGAMDWATLALHADRLKVMAYHYHHARAAPGPVAPPDWVERVARFALEQIPRDKLCVVLTLHGLDWPAGGVGRALDSATALRLATTHQAQWQRDRASGTPSFRYTAQGIPHEVWIDDALSLRRNIARLRRSGVRAIGLWHLGAGDALIREAIRAAQDPHA